MSYSDDESLPGECDWCNDDRGLCDGSHLDEDRRFSIKLLGNVLISKKFLRTRRIMVMHSNERGECYPRTLVNRKRKC